VCNTSSRRTRGTTFQFWAHPWPSAQSEPFSQPHGSIDGKKNKRLRRQQDAGENGQLGESV